MKNILLTLLALVFLNAPNANAQVLQLNQMSLNPPAASQPYACGTIVTVVYFLEYNMTTGQHVDLSFSYNNTQLQLMSFSPSSLGLFQTLPTTIVTPITTNHYKTSNFLAIDNGFTAFTQFTLTFLVINCDCTTGFNSNVVMQASTPAGSDLHTVTTAVNVNNATSVPTIDIELSNGSECAGAALYKITTTGKDAPTNSTLTLTLPVGASVFQVHNAIGNLVPVTHTGTTWSWSRLGGASPNMQIQYVLVKFPPCPYSFTLSLSFTTHNICGTGQTTVTATRDIACICPTPGGSNSGSSIVPGVGMGVGGVVVITKTLEQYPFRYLPAPDNCKTHNYYIQIDNLSDQNIYTFQLQDLLSAIGTYWNAITVTGISASLAPNSGTSGNGSFTFTAIPTSPSITIPPDGLFYPVYGSMPTLPSSANPTFKLLSMMMPKYSTLVIKITHRLNVPNSPATAPYVNKANLTFTTTMLHQASAQFVSVKDGYAPELKIEKRVRNLTAGGPFSATATASPGQTLQFQVKIWNYGMLSVNNASLSDVITNSPSIVYNFNNITPLTLAAISGSTSYTIAERTLIQNAINSSITNNGFNIPSFTIHAAPCSGFSELIITYNVMVKSSTLVVCNSEYTNTATLNWVWNGPQSLTDAAAVSIDLFKNIQYKLEATCDSTKNPPWYTNNITGVQQQIIYYRATVQNNNTYPVLGLKIMVQLPCGITASTNASTHMSSPVTNLLSTIGGGAPPNAGLYPTMMATNPGAISELSTAINNWLDAGPLPTTPVGQQAIYQVNNTLAPGQTAIIEYYVTVPISANGATYNTAMGISLPGCNIPGNELVVQTNLLLTVNTSNICKTRAGCDLIMFDSQVQTVAVNHFRVTLSNILSLYGGNIDVMNIMVGEPYKDCPGGPDYNKTMLSYSLDGLIAPGVEFQSTYTPSSGMPAAGQRYIQIMNVGTGNYGNVTFDINATGAPAPGCPLVFPINIVFKDNTKCSTICESNIYLTIKTP